MRKLLQTVIIFFLVFTIVFSAGCAGTTKNSENKSNGSVNPANGSAKMPPSPNNGSANMPPSSNNGPANMPPSSNNGPANMPPSSNNGQSGPQSSGSATINASGVYSQNGGSETNSSQIFNASNKDESGILVKNNGTFTLSDSTILKTGSTSSSDNSDFYGLNAGVLAESGSIIKLTNCTVTTNANGANGVFSTGTGSLITQSNVTIKTSSDGSRGVDATQTGNITCTNVYINTKGQHCTAIATDRGQGTVVVIGGTMNTAGDGSPGIYSTGNITVSNATLLAKGSEAAVIEGKNSISLNNVTLSGMKKCGAMLY